MSAADAGYGDWMPPWYREADDESADQNGHRGHRIPSGTVEIEYRIGGMSATQRAGQSLVMEHTRAMACGEHVAGPLLVASLGRIEVTAPREFRGAEALRDDHGCAAVRAVPSGWACTGGCGLCWRSEIHRHELPTPGQLRSAESVCQKPEVTNPHKAFWQHMQEEAA